MTNDDEDGELELQFHSNSCSHASCEEFHLILSENRTETSAFQLNIRSMSKHFDKLGTCWPYLIAILVLLEFLKPEAY